MKSILLALIFVVSFANELQAQFNDYKYIIVPKQFAGFNRENQYKTSTLVKHLLNQKKFVAIYGDFLPEDLQANRCLGLVVGLVNSSSMFTTKVVLTFKDCAGVAVFVTQQGRSKEKDYESSFAEAINNAFKSFDGISYNYEPKREEKSSKTITVSMKNDVKNIDERSNLRKNRDALVNQVATSEQQYYKDNRPVGANFNKVRSTEQNSVNQVATEEVQSFESTKPQESTDYKMKNNTPTSRMKSDVQVLYAQETSNGYQLVDSSPSIKMQLMRSSEANFYIAESGTINGVVYTKNGKWFFEYYNANDLVTEELNIKF